MTAQEFENIWNLMVSQQPIDIVQTDDENLAVTVLLGGSPVRYTGDEVSIALLRALYEGGDGAIYTGAYKVFALGVGSDGGIVVRDPEQNFTLYKFSEILDELVEGEKVWFWDALQARVAGCLS